MTAEHLETLVADLLERAERRFYGKYRGVVANRDDPLNLGRIQAKIPSVLGDIVSGWATACVPCGGAANQGLLSVPQVGAGVWIEFEEGDLEFPIWTGTYWSTGELPTPTGSDGAPANPQQPPTYTLLKTAKGHSIEFDDTDGHEAIRVHDGVNHSIVTMDAAGVTITDAHGNTLALTSAGITIGAHAADGLIKGTTFKSAVTSFLAALNTHTHTHPMGPTGPPVKPHSLDVPLSKHTVG